ncbi:gonadotropin-releasing hormone receptor-like isoform X1 [Mytilus trossulus]|uniref:gonadotropin-releasing hormone receptor-like isoform X1 n=1 Tax=Mytilus trossulus TaxID=6551 RepID=UPI0030054F02
MDRNFTYNVTSSFGENVTFITSSKWPLLTEQPPTFNEAFMTRTIILSLLFLMALIGNTATIIQMYRMRKRRSTINILIVNLAIADLLITFFIMGVDAVWASTVQWLAGNVMCKIIKFGTATGLLASTYIIVVISLDRCCVIMDPISRHKAPKRVKIMIVISWILSALFSLPQVFIFSVLRGPFEEDFYQCVDKTFPYKQYQKMYNMFSLITQFMIPLGIMVVSYGLIFYTISRKSKEFREPEHASTSSESARGQVRSTFMRKAKRKALRMSIFIVATFIVCWFPYYVIFTRKAFGHSEETYDATLLTVLTTIGQSNAVLNPIIYGAFHLCKVHKPRFMKRDKSPGTCDKIPFIRRYTRHEDHDGANGTNMTIVAMRRNTVIMCKCSQTPALIKQSKVPCIIIMCKCDEGTKPLTEEVTSSGDT